MFKITIRVVALVAAAAGAHAATLDVPSAMYPTLPIALNAAASGDEIVLAPGTYIAVPGFVVNDKQLTIRGATSDPADVVLDGFNVAENIVLTIQGEGADGTRLESLTVTRGVGEAAASTAGAGVRVSDADVSIHNCIISDNRVTSNESDGPGVFVNDGDLTLTHTVFIGNAIGPAGDGGAVFVVTGDVLIDRCHFEDNGQDIGAIDAAARAGAFRADDGIVTVKRTTFVNNRAGRGGAVFFSSGVTYNIDACVFADNLASTGGAIYCSGDSGSRSRVIRNCLLTRNESIVNDGVIFTNSPMTIANCTIADNVAGGDYIIGGSPSSGVVVVDNCIVWGNTLTVGVFPAGMDPVVRSSTLQTDANLGAGSFANTLDDPIFVSSAGGDYRLDPNSPDIDAGDSTLYAGPFADLDGALRGMDIAAVADTGFAIDGPVIDKGCYEVQPDITVGPGCPGDLTGDDAVNFEDLNQLLENWGQTCP